MTSILKSGNNGTVSCTNFCLNQTGNWGQTYANCVSASRVDNNQQISCDSTANTALNCYCSNPIIATTSVPPSVTTTLWPSTTTSVPPSTTTVPPSVSTLGPLYTEVVFYLVSPEDTDAHWESYWDSRSDRACPTLECRGGFQEYAGRCYDQQYLAGGWNVTSAGIATRDCPSGSSCVSGYCTYERPTGDVPGTTCDDDSLRNDGTSCWKDCNNREATSDRPCDSLRNPVYAAETCSGSKKTSIGTWIAVTRDLTLSCPTDKKYNRVGRTCYEQDCGHIKRPVRKRCNSSDKRLENSDSICYTIPRDGFDCRGTTTCSGPTCSKSIASVDRYKTDAACQDNMDTVLVTETGETNCRQYDYYCRNEYYSIESSDCRCATTSGNANCPRGTARRCAIFDINRLNNLGPAGLIKGWKRVNRDNHEDTNKLYRITLDLTKLVASTIDTVYDNIKKYFITDQGFTNDQFFDIRFIVNDKDYKQYRVFPKKYNDISLEMMRMYIFYTFPLSSDILTTFQPSQDLSTVLIFFIMTPTTPYNQVNDISKTDRSPPKAASYGLSAWSIVNQLSTNAPPVFLDINSTQKVVFPNKDAWQLSLSLSETSNPNGSITNISFVRQIDTTDWPEDFVTSSQAVYAGYLNLADNLINLGNNNFKALMAFKQNFMTKQAEYGLPEAYRNWNENVYYNLILPKISTVEILDDETYCPAQLNYFSTDPSTTTRRCLFMTSTYCNYNNIESGQCDVNRYCMTSTGLREKQQPANSQRTKTILDAAMSDKCNYLCTSAKLNGFCPMECQCLMRNMTPFLQSNQSVVDLTGNAGCWFAPCQAANESKYFIPQNLLNPSCPQTVCQNIVDIYKVQGNVGIKNISFDNQCAPYVPIPTPTVASTTTRNPSTSFAPSAATASTSSRSPSTSIAPSVAISSTSSRNPSASSAPSTATSSTSSRNPSASSAPSAFLSTPVAPLPVSSILSTTTSSPGGSAPSSSSKKIGIIIGIVLLLLLLFGGGGYFYFRKNSAASVQSVPPPS